MNDSTETNPAQAPAVDHSPVAKRSLPMVLVQIIGFMGSIAALGWAVSMALREENREQLSKLSQATPTELMMLMGLATISVGFNGMLFWVVMNPVHKLRPTDVIATNAISTLLAYLPFKLSIVSRFVIHNRRDKIPILTIGAWIVAVTLLMLAVFGPITLASLWQREINTLWWIVSGIGILGSTLLGSWIARKLKGDVGTRRVAKLLGNKLTATDSYSRLHIGFEILANQRAAVIGNVFRVLDIGSFALRFYVAAIVLDLPISGADSLLLGATYFLIGMASPVGMLGTREAGTIAIASMVGISSAALTEDQGGETPIVIAVLFVTAIEAIVNLACAGFGIAWLRLRPGLNVDSEDADHT
ncbi:MAG: flippase-like domain-containing protein [Phycisphaerales bacterium]|nr:flippase-like domain-containing protein [Phycisphaerales bacterium]